MSRQRRTTCLRCQRGVPPLARYCPTCGARAQGLGRLLGALPRVLAGATVAAAGVLLQVLLGPLASGLAASSNAAVSLAAGLPAEVLGVSDVLFAFAGAGLAVLALGRPGLVGRLAVGAAVAPLAAACLGLAAPDGDAARLVLVAAAALAGALFGAPVLAWSSERAPFRWLSRRLAPLPWSARVLAAVPLVSAVGIVAPWLVLAIYAISVGRWLRGGPSGERAAPSRAAEEAAS